MNSGPRTVRDQVLVVYLLAASLCVNEPLRIRVIITLDEDILGKNIS